MKKLKIGYDTVLSEVSAVIKKAERIAIIGENGKGKSTLLKTVVGEINPLGGSYQFGNRVDFAYFDQHKAVNQKFDPEQTVLDYFWSLYPNLLRNDVRSALGAFLFSGEDVDKKVKVLSGGERTRLAMVRLLLEPYNVLILDEPTNHLDVASREKLYEMVKNGRSTMLIVSHDRYFINKIADRILLLTNNGVKEYLGNYDYYLERTTAEKSGAVPTENKKDKKEKTQNDYFLQKQKQSEERKRQTKLKKAEAEIERLDEEIAKTQELLSSEEVAADYEKLMELSKLLEDLQKQQEEQYEIWEELESMSE